MNIQYRFSGQTWQSTFTWIAFPFSISSLLDNCCHFQTLSFFRCRASAALPTASLETTFWPCFLVSIIPIFGDVFRYWMWWNAPYSIFWQKYIILHRKLGFLKVENRHLGLKVFSVLFHEGITTNKVKLGRFSWKKLYQYIIIVMCVLCTKCCFQTGNPDRHSLAVWNKCKE